MRSRIATHAWRSRPSPPLQRSPRDPAAYSALGSNVDLGCAAVEAYGMQICRWCQRSRTLILPHFSRPGGPTDRSAPPQNGRAMVAVSPRLEWLHARDRCAVGYTPPSPRLRGPNGGAIGRTASIGGHGCAGAPRGPVPRPAWPAVGAFADHPGSRRVSMGVLPPAGLHRAAKLRLCGRGTTTLHGDPPARASLAGVAALRRRDVMQITGPPFA